MNSMEGGGSKGRKKAQPPDTPQQPGPNSKGRKKAYHHKVRTGCKTCR
jgi:hypothetical protein